MGNWGVDEDDDDLNSTRTSLSEAEHNLKQRFDVFYQARQFDQTKTPIVSANPGTKRTWRSGSTHLVRGTGSHDSAPGEISTAASIGQASVLGLHLTVTCIETHGAAD